MDRTDADSDLPHIRSELRRILSEVLGADLSGVEDDTPLLDYLRSSLALVEGLRRAHDRFGVLISIRRVLEDGASLAALSAYIDQARNAQGSARAQRCLPARDSEWGKQRMGFLRREAQLPANMAPARGLTFQPPARPRSALLTGATGFLGAYIVAEVLRATDVHLHCLVRPRNGARGKSRIEEQLRHYDLWRNDAAWQEAWDRRVHVVEGDVILPRLGIVDAAYESLARDLDCVIHSAAQVNFIYPYEALRTTNVLAVHEIIRFAFHGRIKPVHHLSTAAIWPAGSEFTFYEHDPLDHGRLLNLGYNEAKWVAEQCLVSAEERGLPLARYRPGEVGGDSETGRCVLHHFMFAVLKGFLQFGAFPAVATEVDVTPVDYVAKALVHLAFFRDSYGRAFHLTNPRRCHASEAYAFLRRLGYQFEELPFAELRHRLLADSGFTDNALFPYQAVLEEMDERSFEIPRYDCTQTLRALEGSGIVCAPVDERLLGTYLRYLREIGYLPAPVALPAGVGSLAP